MLEVEYKLQNGLVGIISDTHVPTRASSLPPKVFKFFEKADLILHAGDLEEENVLRELKLLAPVVAVAGNMDPYELKIKLGTSKIIHLGKVSLGLNHGDGLPRGRPDLVLSRFRGFNIQALIFGHSHVPLIEQSENVLFINPGSPADPRRGSKPSCARLWLEGRDLQGEILELA
ncbi:MAG: metallophosphoesterase family protein [Firmicutes bacterium]|nr:metallophosphoesterase family protein [Bacillota bacterium]